MFLDFVIS